MKVDSFDIYIKSISFGNEEITLSFGGQKIPFYSTYMGPEPISSLIESLVGLEEEIDNMDYTRYFITWSDEPGTLDFEMYKDNYKDHILIKIKFDNCGIEQYHKTGNWEFDMPYSLYRKTVLNTALKVITEYGLNGLNDSWADGKDTFPICSLISLLGGRSSYYKESDSFRSNILDELKVLTDSIVKWQEQNT